MQSIAALRSTTGVTTIEELSHLKVCQKVRLKHNALDAIEGLVHNVSGKKVAVLRENLGGPRWCREIATGSKPASEAGRARASQWRRGAKAPVARGKPGQGLFQGFGRKVWPKFVAEKQLGISCLPKQKVAHP